MAQVTGSRLPTRFSSEIKRTRERTRFTANSRHYTCNILNGENHHIPTHLRFMIRRRASSMPGN